MSKERSLLEEVADKMGIAERIECDNVLKWDGSRLYVTDEVYRGDHKAECRRRYVTKEIAESIRKLLKGRA